MDWGGSVPRLLLVFDSARLHVVGSIPQAAVGSVFFLPWCCTPYRIIIASPLGLLQNETALDLIAEIGPLFRGCVNPVSACRSDVQLPRRVRCAHVEDQAPAVSSPDVFATLDADGAT
jgi:hypothetical protein